MTAIVEEIRKFTPSFILMQEVTPEAFWMLAPALNAIGYNSPAHIDKSHGYGVCIFARKEWVVLRIQKRMFHSSNMDRELVVLETRYVIWIIETRQEWA